MSLYTCYVCMHVYMWIHVCMDGYQRSTSVVGPHLPQWFRLGLSLSLFTAVNGRRAGHWVFRNSLVSISHLAICMLVLQMWTSHTPFGRLWGSETRVTMLVHQGMCSVSHLPIPNLDRVSNWACSPQIWLDWLAIKLQICLISACQVLRFQGWPLLVFYLGAGDSNSDPHDFK